VICNGFHKTDEKVIFSCLLQYKPICVINFEKLRWPQNAKKKIIRFAVPGSKYKLFLWWLVCCVTAAQCHKLFFHWAAKKPTRRHFCHPVTMLNEAMGKAGSPSNTKSPWAEAYLHTKWHLNPSSHLATTGMGRKLGGCAPLGEGELGLHLTQCGQGRGLPACHVSS